MIQRCFSTVRTALGKGGGGGGGGRQERYTHSTPTARRHLFRRGLGPEKGMSSYDMLPSRASLPADRVCSCVSSTVVSHFACLYVKIKDFPQWTFLDKMIKARTSDMVIDKSLYWVSCQVSSTRHSSRGSTNSLHRSLTWSTAKSVAHGILPEDLQIAFTEVLLGQLPRQ